MNVLEELDCSECKNLIVISRLPSLFTPLKRRKLECNDCPFVYIHPIDREHIKENYFGIKGKSKLFGLRFVCLQRRIKQIADAQEESSS